MLFKSHKEISTAYRRQILEETGLKRVTKVPLETCNAIIESFIEEEQENESLKHFQIEYYKGGKFGSVDAVGRQQALVEVDRIMEFGEYDSKDLVIAVRQAKRLIQGYVKGKWIYTNSVNSIYQYD
jgi:hypothetical protein